MGIFSRRKPEITYGEINIATPAEHIVHLPSEESFGTNILKGYSTGLLTFGEQRNLFHLVNSRSEETGLQVESWGYSYPFMSFPTDDLYLRCNGWIAFRIDVSNSQLWEKWLTHFYPNAD